MTENQGSQSPSELAPAPADATIDSSSQAPAKKTGGRTRKPATAPKRGRPATKAANTPENQPKKEARSKKDQQAEAPTPPTEKAPAKKTAPKGTKPGSRAKATPSSLPQPDSESQEDSPAAKKTSTASKSTRTVAKKGAASAESPAKAPRTGKNADGGMTQEKPARASTAKSTEKASGKVTEKSPGRRGRPRTVKAPEQTPEQIGAAPSPMKAAAPEISPAELGATDSEKISLPAPVEASEQPVAEASADKKADQPEGKTRGNRRGRGTARGSARSSKAAAKAEAEEAPAGAPDTPESASDTAEMAQDPAASEKDEEAKPGKKPSRKRGGRSKKPSPEAGESLGAQGDEDEGGAETALVDEDAAELLDADEEQTRPGKKTAPASRQRRKMFVSVHPEEQIEVVLTEEAMVQEYYVEMLQQAKTKGNIYKAVIHNIDSNLQAAFVNYGPQKNGFLQIDEVHPEYFNTSHEPTRGRKYPPIQKVLKQGQELLVQVVKEPTGTKGAFLTTYLSLPGRFLVLTPGREQIGVSRKVDDDGERSRLRELLNGLTPGPGLGVIVRTASMGTSKTTLQKDLQNLKKTWKEVRSLGTEQAAPSLIYQEMDLTTRAVRDYLTEQVSEIWIDDEPTAHAVEELAKRLFPQKKKLVNVHRDSGTTLFERFNLQRQLDQIHSREVALPSGGRLVIDPTEALTAIDINSGRSGGKTNFEDMAYRTNLEAAKMIPLQLRLRDIGGQVVADFIEMRDKNHWRDVEKTLRNGMKVDRARYDIGKIGPFGMLEMVRQRLGSSAISVSMEVCPLCKGTGIRRNVEWQSQQALKDILRKIRVAQAQKQAELIFEIDPHVAIHLLNNKRQRLVEMEQQTGVRLEVRPVIQ
jgi:ribonuclease, Rne/Rng family